MGLSSCLGSSTRTQLKQSLKPFRYLIHAFAFNSESPPRNLFDESPKQNLVQYNHLLFEYSRIGLNQEALNVFLGIRQLGLSSERSTLSCVLKVSGCLFDLVTGRQVHCECIKSGFVEDVSVGTSLVDMYMKTNNVDDGRRVFDEMNERNVVSWTSLLSGYSRNGAIHRVIELFPKMLVESIRPNQFTFSTVLGALADEGMADSGVKVHTMVIKNGFEGITCVCNALINLYLKSQMVFDARSVFNRMEERDIITWNSMVAGYATNALHMEAFEMFHHMQVSGAKSTQSTFASVIKLCANLRKLEFTKQVHCLVVKNGVEFDHNVRTSLMVTYSKCRMMGDARKIFSIMQQDKNVVLWTAMITGYLQNGALEEAANLFVQMTNDGVRPNDFTYSVILKAQPVISPFQIHGQVIKANYEKSPSVGTALLDAYVKLGNVDGATKVFENIHEKDIVAWSVMLAGYAQAGDTTGAVTMFKQLAEEGVNPNEFTFSSLVNACASSTAAVEQGKQFHALSIKFRLSNALCVSSALVTMYAKKGNIDSANEVFKRQGERDLVSWNSMISGYAQHGHGKKALEVFSEMQKQNLEMDNITFIGVITACTHTGLVEEGERYFDIMVKDHHINPGMEHYSCIVDLFSRAGLLEKALDIVNSMPFPAGATIWRTILAASRVHGNLDLGEIAGEKLISLQPQDSAAYVLLSNLYAAAGIWQKRAKVRKLMDERKVRKEAGYSWIEVKNKTYAFLAGDISHPQSDQIYSKLEDINTRLKDLGYQPDTNYVLQDVDDEHKAAILSQHSERLAIVFGLIATRAGAPLQIVKNLRVCGDCHTVIKLITIIEGRELLKVGKLLLEIQIGSTTSKKVYALVGITGKIRFSVRLKHLLNDRQTCSISQFV